MNTADAILKDGLRKLVDGKRRQLRVDGWFYLQELRMRERETMRRGGTDPDDPAAAGELLCRLAEKMTLSIPEGSALAGTQDDAFSPSYALINPAFRVQSFAGYCDPLAIYDDLEPTPELPPERIEAVRGYYRETPFVRDLKAVYGRFETLTSEVAFFMEPVTGHMIPDMRPILSDGLEAFLKRGTPGGYAPVMRRAGEAVLILARRYAGLAETLVVQRAAGPDEAARLGRIAELCRRVPRYGARNLHEALQSYLLLWQVMCLEQAPNPYAFSAGNLDRVFAPYLGKTPFEEAVALFEHLLAFYMVGARGWAISQNILLGGRDMDGNDLTNAMTGVILEAFRRSNLPQPALSVKIHRGTPDSLYRAMGKFFFIPGHSTPSLFNDDMMFELLAAKGIAPEDIPDWAVAGCQEPLIMGRENGNTTNSWLNLGKVLELALNDGRSLLTGRKIGLSAAELGYTSPEEAAHDLENAFFRQLDFILPRMEEAANCCTRAISRCPTPFGSLLFGGLESGRDMRDAEHPGTRCNGSGCLIHGLSVAADSIVAVKHFLAEEPGGFETLLAALRSDFAGAQLLRARLLGYPKYGANRQEPDETAVRVAARVCEKVSALRNPSGAPFMPDFSTPSTHLLYGCWVGATPDGRNARTMLGYGIDPRPEAVSAELTDQLLSERKLPFGQMTGGYASHIGLSPAIFADTPDAEAKGIALRDRIVRPLFSAGKEGAAPYYVYFNIDSAAHLRRILADPEKLVPSGIYIMRIHGTFVNFLDLSPAIQEDIVRRLERSECA